MLLIKDILRELKSLYNYINKSEIIVNYNSLGLPYLLIYNIIK
jgi:hypothetical protein